MAWFRRRRSPEPTPAPSPEPDTERAADDGASTTAGDAPGTDLVPLVSGQSLARTERALKMLAAQSAQTHSHVVHLEQRVDALSEALLDRLDVPSHDDILQARMHSARVAAELARLEVNLAARLDAVRDELRAVQADPDAPAAEIDLRALTPADTGWSTPHA